MTPKEKAENIVWMYSRILRDYKSGNSFVIKKCALIAVDEMIEMDETLRYKKYLQKVKKEIGKLL